MIIERFPDHKVGACTIGVGGESGCPVAKTYYPPAYYRYAGQGVKNKLQNLVFELGLFESIIQIGWLYDPEASKLLLLL
jgi:hypothetical protein